MQGLEIYGLISIAGATVTGILAYREYQTAARRWIRELRAEGRLASLAQIPLELSLGFLILLLGVLAWPLTLLWLYDQRKARLRLRREREEAEYLELSAEIRRAKNGRN